MYMHRLSTALRVLLNCVVYLPQMIELLKEQVYHKNVVRSIAPRDDSPFMAPVYHHHHHRYPANVSGELIAAPSIAAEHLRWDLESTSSIHTGASSITEQLNDLRQQLLSEQAKHQQQMAAEVREVSVLLLWLRFQFILLPWLLVFLV